MSVANPVVRFLLRASRAVSRPVAPGVLPAALVAALLAAGCSGPPEAASDGMPLGPTWSFEADPPGAAPAGFRSARTGPGRDGAWVVRAVPDAADGRQVLRQEDADPTDPRFPQLVAEAPVARDVRVTVRARALSGEIDQCFGLVARWQGPDDYLLLRANCLEDNVRLYHVVGGVRQQTAHWRGRITPHEWHTLQFEVRGDELVGSYDGQEVVRTRDDKVTAAGRAGVWTKADSVTEFDALAIESLDPRAPQVAR